MTENDRKCLKMSDLGKNVRFGEKCGIWGILKKGIYNYKAYKTLPIVESRDATDRHFPFDERSKSGMSYHFIIIRNATMRW